MREVRDESKDVRAEQGPRAWRGGGEGRERPGAGRTGGGVKGKGHGPGCSSAPGPRKRFCQGPSWKAEWSQVAWRLLSYSPEVCTPGSV